MSSSQRPILLHLLLVVVVVDHKNRKKQNHANPRPQRSTLPRAEPLESRTEMSNTIRRSLDRSRQPERAQSTPTPESRACERVATSEREGSLASGR
jgi:hypothetical protein